MEDFNKSMLLVTSDWGGKKTFKMIPFNNNCPFSEGIFDPESKVLVLMAKLTKQSFHMLPKLDEDGKPIPIKHSATKAYKEQRVSLETFPEYYIVEKNEIEDAVNRLALNLEFDYKQYITTPTQSTSPQEIKKEE